LRTPVRNTDTSWTTVSSDRQCWNFAGDAPGPGGPWFDVLRKMTRRSGSGKGTGRSITALTTEKIAVLAPMPRVNAATAASVKAGLCRNIRSDCFKSLTNASSMGS
jgi:hypothetical protein